MPTDDLDDDLLDEQADLPEDLDEADLEDLEEEDDDEGIDDEVIDDDSLDEDTLEDDDENPPEVEAKVAREDDEEEDDDDDEDSDDVEASLDVILKERLVVADDEDEDDDEEIGDPDERGDSPQRVLPKQPGEFVCQSCFLVKHPSQLADPARTLCRDCV
jgi:Domain of unknown function (DUF4193)